MLSALSVSTVLFITFSAFAIAGGIIGYGIAKGTLAVHFKSKPKHTKNTEEEIYLPNDEFEKKYGMADTAQEKVNLIKQRQKSIEKEKALEFIERTKELCDYDKNKENKKELLLAFIKNIQEQKEPLGIAGIFFRVDKNTLPETLNFDLSSRIKDDRIEITQFTIFQIRIIEFLLVILNNFEILTEKKRKELLEEYLGEKYLVIGGISYTSSSGLFSDEITYNEEIRNGQVEFLSEKRYQKIEEPCLKENGFVYGGGAFMKDELIKLLNISPTEEALNSLKNDIENNADKPTENQAEDPANNNNEEDKPSSSNLSM